jgi:hypothetical protein
MRRRYAEEAPTPTPTYLVLQATPRVARLGWPHDIGARVYYKTVYVKPDGSGWTTEYDDSLIFDETKLDQVLEAFYESAGPYPFDFTVAVVRDLPRDRLHERLAHLKTKKARAKKAPKKTPRRTGAKAKRSRPRVSRRSPGR